MWDSRRDRSSRELAVSRVSPTRAVRGQPENSEESRKDFGVLTSPRPQPCARWREDRRCISGSPRRHPSDRAQRRRRPRRVDSTRGCRRLTSPERMRNARLGEGNGYSRVKDGPNASFVIDIARSPQDLLRTKERSILANRAAAHRVEVNSGGGAAKSAMAPLYKIRPPPSPPLPGGRLSVLETTQKSTHSILDSALSLWVVDEATASNFLSKQAVARCSGALTGTPHRMSVLFQPCRPRSNIAAFNQDAKHPAGSHPMASFVLRRVAISTAWGAVLDGFGPPPSCQWWTSPLVAAVTLAESPSTPSSRLGRPLALSRRCRPPRATLLRPTATDRAVTVSRIKVCGARLRNEPAFGWLVMVRPPIAALSTTRATASDRGSHRCRILLTPKCTRRTRAAIESVLSGCS